MPNHSPEKLSVQDKNTPIKAQETALITHLNQDYRNQDNDEIDLRELWSTSIRRKWTIITITLLTLATVTIGTLMVTPIYRASITLKIDMEDTQQLLDYGIEVQPQQMVNSKDFYQTQYQLLKSRSLARRTIDQLDLENHLNDYQLEKPFYTEKFEKIFKLFNDSTIDNTENNLITDNKKSNVFLGSFPVEEKLLANLTIQPVKNSQIVTVHYDDSNPEIATNVANSIAENYINMNLERRLDAASYAKVFLNEQLTIAKSRLLESEKNANDFARLNKIISTDDKQTLSSQRLVELSVALTKAQEDSIKAESELHQSRATANAKLLDNETLEKLETKLAELERSLQTDVMKYNAFSDSNTRELRVKLINLQNQYQEKLAIYKPAYPDMQQLQKQIRDLKSQINAERQNINSFERNNLQRQLNEVRRQIVQQTANITDKVTADLAAKFEAAKQREEALRTELEAQKTELMALRDKGVGYNTLNREVETNRNLYEGLLQRLKEVGVAGGVGSNNISIVDPAILPYAKHKPNTKLNLMLGAVLGLFIGTVIAFLLEFLDDRVKSTDELERLLKLPLLGITPLIKRQSDENIALMSAENPTSALAEAFRSLRTNLLFATTEGAPHSLSVTSSMPSEAKSSTCINLATTFAQSGKRILVVDADLRKPTSHKRLKLDNSQGLSNYLTGQNSIDDVVQPTKIDNVFVITAGPLAPNPAELLSSERMQALLNLAPSEYDMIIVDSPPVMGLADALIIANRVTATVMVVAHNQSKKRAIGDAFQRLKQAHANIIGAVFTKAKSGSAYGYSYDYEYYYTYGSDQRRIGNG